MSVLIKLRRGTSLEWSSKDIVLNSGEPGFETDTQRLKIGDGTTAWNSLNYTSIIPTGFLSGSGINIDLGSNGSTATISVSGSFIAESGTFDQVIFNTGLPDPNLLAGQLQWNATEGTLDLGLNDSYAMHLGEEMLYRVRNVTGSTLLAGQPVYASGLSPGGNNRIEVNLYTADGTIREIRFMGLMTEDLTDNGNNGYATHFGYIRGVDTRGDAATYGTTNKLWTTGEPAWNEGDILYVHPTVPGKLTKIEPKHSISVAIITNVASNGKLFVRPTSYGHLDDNHDVNVSGVTNGQFLQYSSATDYWVPSSSGNFTNLSINGNQIPIGSGLANHIAYWNSSSGLVADSGQLYWDSSNNRLGIGTINPSSSLTVQIPSSSNNTIIQSSGATPDPLLQIITYPTLNRCQLRIGSYNSTIAPNYSFFNDPDTGIGGGFVANTLQFITSAEERVRIDSNGRVGIGTTSPTTALDVSGVITATDGNSTNWNTAYGWGNHASAGYQSASTALTTSTSFGGDVTGTYNNISIVDDSHNHIISNIDGLQTALDGKLSTSLKGANSGVAELDAGGKVPSSQLPSYVDDVLEYANLAGFPVTGETGKIYVAIDTNLTYRWSGSSYVEISASLALGETSSTAYRGDRGKAAYEHSIDTTGSIHGSTNVGGNLLRLTDPSAIRFLRVNADNSVSTLNDSDFRTAIGAGTSSTTGTVTSVVGTGTVAGLTLTGTVTSTGNLTLGGSLSTATSSTNGGVKLGSDTVQSVAANNVTATSSRTYAIQLNSTGQAVVNVPWVDTDTNTTYSAGSGITLTGTTFSHTDTSSQASVNNSNGNVIQDITLDTYGHITALNSTDLDSRYYTETETDSLFSPSGHTHTLLTNGGFEEFNIASNNIQGFFLAKTQNNTDGAIGIETYDNTFTRDGLAILGVRNGDGFLQGLSSNFRIEQAGGSLGSLVVQSINAGGSGNFASNLYVNNVPVSVSGHTHTVSDITNFNSSVSGLLPTISNSGDNRILTSTGSAVGINAESNLTFNGNVLNVVGSGSFSSTISATGGNSTQWNTAYGWGDHSTAGYQLASTALTTSTNFGGDVSGTYNNIVIADDSHNHIISNVDGLQNALDAKAPLASPTFTGTPAAPTAASGTNTTQIATTAFVRTEISNLVDAAPGTLDTLNELAAALGDDPNFATTVTNNIATKVAKSGDTMTGTLNAPSGVFSGNVQITSQTASTVASFDSNKNVTSLSTATYPNLTELSYVKGVTSAIQTQLNAKQNSLTNPVTGTGITNHIAYWNSSSGIAVDSGQLYWDSSNNRLGVGTSSPSYQLDVVGTGNFSQNLLVNGTGVSISGHTHSLLTNGGFEEFNIAGGGTQGFFLAKTQNTSDGAIGIETYDNSLARDGFAILGVRNGNGFLQGLSDIFRIEKNFGLLGDLELNNIYSAGSGNFANNLYVNSVAVSLSGHTHTTSDITDFNSSVSGLLPTIANSGDNRILTSTGTSTGVNAESNLTFNGSTLAVSGNLDVSTTGDINTLKINSFYHQNLSVATGIADNDLLIAIVDPTGTATTEVIQGSTLRSSLLNQPAQLQFRQGTDTERLLITPASGEPIWTTDTQKFYIGDGNTVGGDFIGPSPYDFGNGLNSIVNINSSSVNSGIYSNILGGSGNVINSGVDYSVIVGGSGQQLLFSSISNDFAFIGGGSNNSASGIYATICGGSQNRVWREGFIGGGKGNIIGSGTTLLTTIFGLGYNSAICAGEVNLCDAGWSFVGGGYGNRADNTSSNSGVTPNFRGLVTICGGLDNRAGIGSFIGGGYANRAYAEDATSGGSVVVGGASNTASGIAVSVGGGLSNLGVGSASIIPGGFGAKTRLRGELAHAAGRFGTTIGAAQHSILVAQKFTDGLDTSPQTMFLGESTDRLIIPAETTWTFTIKLSAYNDTDNEGAWWIFRGGIRRNAANGTALIGSLITENGAESSFSTASANVSADDTNEALNITVTPMADKNVRWVAVIDISQVSYGTP